MDQISGAIRWMKKNGFWLGCFFMSALMIGIWCFRVITSLDVATEAGVKKIEQKIETAKRIQQVSAEGVEDEAAHPNSHSEEGIRAEMSQTVDSIIEGWEKRVDDQKKTLKWPSKVIGSERFATTFSRYNPPELIPDTWLQGDGSLRPLLDLYAKNIPKQMVVLTGDDLLRTRWNYDPERLEAERVANASTAQGGGTGFSRGGGGGYDGDYGDEYDEGGGYPGGGYQGGSRTGGPETPGIIIDELTGEQIDMNSYAVIWNDTNQQLWQTKMTEFKGREDNQLATNTPTPLQCYMLQQDLWLLEAMFKIIREVNGDADANDISTIKRLDHVVFGRDVGGKLGQLTPFDPRLGSGLPGMGGGDGDFEMDYEDEMEQDYDDGGYDRDMGMGGEGAVLVSPVEDRYVDSNFEPLAAEKVKTILAGTELPEEEDLELIVSKRVPVRIAVQMKETEIANFMAACANSPFAFEIQQVRWNRHIPGEEIPIGGSTRTGGFGAAYGGSRDYGGGYGGGSATGGPILKSTPVEIRTNYDVNVEFYGIVKIYNPVRPKVLRAAAGLEEEVDPNDAATP